jgi:hypothetical protein
VRCHARSQASKSGQNKSKRCKDEKRAACFGTDAKAWAVLPSGTKIVATTEISHSGLNALLTPEESVLVLVDHQAFQFANLHSHEPQLVVNNVAAETPSRAILFRNQDS